MIEVERLNKSYGDLSAVIEIGPHHKFLDFKNIP
jgi:hypothetical protein